MCRSVRRPLWGAAASFSVIATVCVANLGVAGPAGSSAVSASSGPPAPLTPDLARGYALYSMYCAACHQATGEGSAGAFPPLKGSAVVNKDDATKQLDAVLRGIQGGRVSGVVYSNPMPAFGATLNDADIAAIVNYERQAWGNHGRPVSVAQVTTERAARSK